MFKAEPSGLGGWLGVVAFGLVASLIQQLGALFTEILPIFTSGKWAALTNSARAGYRPLAGVLVVAVLVGTLAVIVASSVALWFYFRRSPRFPGFMISYFFGALVLFAALYALELAAVPPRREEPPHALMAVIRAAILCAIWIPYMTKSRRVRNTFVPRDQPALPPGTRPDGTPS